ncbi:MAG TPA: ferrous iron transport protein B, partial [Porphyromonadaceae bacterium]|nr:ferrous iron transport protein B [Porphyromonadaceae bacterium]
MSQKNDISQVSLRPLDNEPVGAVVKVARVQGGGAFRQRLLEMGFVRGAEITVIKNAPLLDPVEYMILGSHISLRRVEAARVMVVDAEVELQATAGSLAYNGTTLTVLDEQDPMADNVLRVALVGNPNCGKTSLFNFVTGAREKVGNYGGVTVDSKEGSFVIDGHRIELVDLPGTYSLTEYSPEEMYVRTYLRDKHPDAILNIVDAGNMERNLYLTTQIMDMNIPMVIALNMWDEFEKSGDRLDIEAMSRLLGAPIIPVTARDGQGVDRVLQACYQAIEESEQKTTHKNVNYGTTVEDAIAQLETLRPDLNRYTLLKIIENDRHALELLDTADNAQQVRQQADRLREKIEREYNDDIVTVVSDLKYGFVRGALAEVLTTNS